MKSYILLETYRKYNLDANNIQKVRRSFHQCSRTTNGLSIMQCEPRVLTLSYHLLTVREGKIYVSQSTVNSQIITRNSSKSNLLIKRSCMFKSEIFNLKFLDYSCIDSKSIGILNN